MFTMGDEYGHTKGGNNNTYCHDAPLNWFDWAQAEADPDGLMRFCSKLIHLRHSTPALRLRTHPSGAQIDWHGTQPKQPDWSEGSRFVAYTLTDQGSLPIFVGFNASHLPQYTTLPDPGRGNMWTVSGRIDVALSLRAVAPWHRLARRFPHLMGHLTLSSLVRPVRPVRSW